MKKNGLLIVGQVFNPSTWESEAYHRISEFQASLVYRVRSRTARAITQRNPVSNNNNNKPSKQINKKAGKEKGSNTATPTPIY